MRGRMIMRMLMMFGPMLLRQFQKFQRNKERQAQQQPVDHQEQHPAEDQPKTYTEKDFV